MATTKSYKLMTPANGEGVYLAHPSLEPGWRRNCWVYRVDGVPEGVELSEVIRLFGLTANVTWLFGPGPHDPEAGGRFVFDWSELGVGKLIKK